MAGKRQACRARRGFRKTKQPSDAIAVAPSNRRRLVIQEHDATRLHDDLRLGLDGIFTSGRSAVIGYGRVLTRNRSMMRLPKRRVQMDFTWHMA